MAEEQAPDLGAATTRELLMELRTRGDVASTARPGTEVGADGAMLSGIVRCALGAMSRDTLDYRTTH